MADFGEMESGSTFFRVKNDFFQLTHILSVRKVATPSKGKDGVKRDWIVIVSKDAIGSDCGSKYQNIWCSSKEIRSLLEYMEGSAL